MHAALLSSTALAAVSPELRSQLTSLVTRHGVPGGLLSEGKRLLETAPREEMLREAAPLARNGSPPELGSFPRSRAAAMWSG